MKWHSTQQHHLHNLILQRTPNEHVELVKASVPLHHGAVDKALVEVAKALQFIDIKVTEAPRYLLLLLSCWIHTLILAVYFRTMLESLRRCCKARSRLPVAFPDIVDCREQAEAANAKEDDTSARVAASSTCDEEDHCAYQQVRAQPTRQDVTLNKQRLKNQLSKWAGLAKCRDFKDLSTVRQLA